MKRDHESKESREDYLEAIYMILQHKKVCRSVDVAEHLNVSKPSVSVAMTKLIESGYVKTDEDKFLELPEKGHVIADGTYKKHMFFKNALVMIGVDEETAEKEACLLEHDISEESFQKLQAFHDKYAKIQA